MHGSDSVPAEAARYITRYRYRKEFGLTAAQMDAEPLDEVNAFMEIWEATDRRKDLEEKRQQQRNNQQNHGR